jgi:hypothetical protein
MNPIKAFTSFLEISVVVGKDEEHTELHPGNNRTLTPGLVLPMNKTSLGIC